MDAWGQLSVQASSQQSVDNVVEHIYIYIHMYIWRFCLSNIKVSSLVLFIQTLWAVFGCLALVWCQYSTDCLLEVNMNVLTSCSQDQGQPV